MTETLDELRDILQRQGHPGQADFVDRLLQLQERDPEEFRDLLQSATMWGGAGAVWEVYPLGDDNRRFGQLVVRLVGEMEPAGLGTPRSRQVAGVFSQWLAAGILYLARMTPTPAGPPASTRRGTGR
jgi:hypothetical protein